MNELKQPRIQKLSEKKLLGHVLKMSLANDRTYELWSGFMPKRKLIDNVVGTDIFSVQVYSKIPNFNDIEPHIEFEKWAAVEVAEFSNGIVSFKRLLLPSGLYAVFMHSGTPSDFHNTLKAIHVDWMPNSGYELDDRPHFEVLGEKYKNNHPDSEEEVWVPIKRVIDMR